MTELPLVTDFVTDALFQEQLELEREMCEAGRERSLRRLQQARANNRGALVGGGRKTLDTLLGLVVAGFEAFYAAAKDGRPGRRHDAYRYAKELKPELLAYTTLHVSLNLLLGQGGSSTLASVAMRVGRFINIEHQALKLKEANPAFAGKVMASLNSRTSNDDHRSRVLRAAILDSDAEVDIEPWPNRVELLVGLKCLDILQETTGILDIVAVPIARGGKDRKVENRVRLRSEILEKVDEVSAAVASNMILMKPTLIPPRPWTDARNGGFWSQDVQARRAVANLIIGRGKTRLTETPGPLLAALNTAQATPWRVNKRVLAVLEALWDGQMDTPLIPPRGDDEMPLPGRPDDIDTNEAARKVWRREAAKVYQKRTEAGVERFALIQTLTAAREYAGRDRFWYVHRLDFRGRMYPMETSAAFHPQGRDMTKGLLEFADGKPLQTTDAVRWLAIKGANSWGLDKKPLHDRVMWAHQEGREIALSVDRDPLADPRWQTADEPWQFLAWCFDWAGHFKHGDSWLSHSVVAMDGTCNGLQHYSAMLRDPVGGKATNLIPSSAPQDIYAEVARVVTEQLRVIARGPAETPEQRELALYAMRLLDMGIDRKITKRPVMVLPYGGTRRSCGQYVREALLEREAGARLVEEYGQGLINFLADLVWDGIGNVVVAARAAMDWLRTASKVASKAGIALDWIVPHQGLNVRQFEAKRNRNRLDTMVFGRRVTLSYKEHTVQLDPQRQANAFPPNFVHSLDADCLVETINHASERGVTHFAMVHDSYGTHAADAPQLARSLREVFVDVYGRQDPLADFRDRLLAALPEDQHSKIPELPAKGSLDLSQVLASQYFFS